MSKSLQDQYIESLFKESYLNWRFWWRKYPRIFIVARNYVCASNWADLPEIQLPKHQYTYVDSRDKLQGIRSGLIILLNGWERSDRGEEIMEFLIRLEGRFPDTLFIKTEKDILDEQNLQEEQSGESLSG